MLWGPPRLQFTALKLACVLALTDWSVVSVPRAVRRQPGSGGAAHCRVVCLLLVSLRVFFCFFVFLLK